ncbi:MULTISPECIES: DNA polymerase III subunit gamma/tau [unclassified Facklamia]|uniref:DNA polymerase III subunit gamma/tau n=1 Tax=Aerococcaceae TaxID=186827 RepID=UPI0013B93FF7|nr:MULTISPECIES: DNA polymerase III subunit gamma/tau [unclassified Facklamia]NEW65136.1 DNA polymerase III subunit gamma/tau [Facklamia sp. 252]NEW68666.1 DNA polymerase III subunit gamma/tau [Facklamia sp. 253]QQD65529.1 DNA polymerase III subunit gamma/tau [Aerococcaceae bacterium zg-252]
MSYQALYRVWRPQSFDELVGQPMIAETLKNAVKYDQLSHAYLFTGPRGTGKTSVAKILAKAVNCPNQIDGNPCNECELCQAITSGQLPDVVEIDAASNNGVDEIRELRDKVRYAPTQAKYKVYIIDEVHMLTTGAFNALLKTLEEPPAHVLFILATTEPHKIPATILSRTQRFDFQRIKDVDLIGRMQYILDQRHIPAENDALKVIARAANGGMRDSLSLLDQALSYQSDKLTLAAALEVSGSVNHQVYVNYIEDIYQESGTKALMIVKEVLQSGKQASRFIEELILFARDVLLSHHTKHNDTLLSDEELMSLNKVVPATFYFQLIHSLNQAQSQMRFSNAPDLYLEIVTIQLAQNKGNVAIATQESSPNKDVLLQRIEQLEQKVKQLESQLVQTLSAVGQKAQAEQVAVTTPRIRPSAMKRQYQQQTQEIYRVLDQATRAHIERLKQQWPTILANVNPQERAKFNGTYPLAAGAGVGLISFKNEAFCGMVQNDSHLQQQLETLCAQLIREPIRLVYILDSEWHALRQEYKLLREKNGGKPLMPPIKDEVKEVRIESNDVSSLEQSEPIEVEMSDDTFDVPGVEVPKPVETIGGVLQRENMDNEIAVDETPEVIAKAIELFGENNVTILYDE